MRYRCDPTVRSLGRIAQLVRASGLHPEGRGFESLFAHRAPAGPRSAGEPEEEPCGREGTSALVGVRARRSVRSTARPGPAREVDDVLGDSERGHRIGIETVNIVTRRPIETGCHRRTALYVPFEAVAVLASPESFGNCRMACSKQHRCDLTCVAHGFCQRRYLEDRDGVRVDEPPVSQITIVLPHRSEVPLGEVILPRGRMRQVETVSLDDGMLHVSLGEEIVQSECDGRLACAGTPADEDHRGTRHTRSSQRSRVGRPRPSTSRPGRSPTERPGSASVRCARDREVALPVRMLDLIHEGSREVGDRDAGVAVRVDE